MKKKDNTCEISVTGITKQTYLHDDKKIHEFLEEICENKNLIYKFKISKYELEVSEKRSLSTIEVYRNLKYEIENVFDNKLNKEFFDENIKFSSDLDLFFNNCDNFIKYISNVMIPCDIGKMKIVEYSRCDCNIENIIQSLGYKKKLDKKQYGCMYKYKYLPILLLVLYDNNEKEDKNSSYFIINIIGIIQDNREFIISNIKKIIGLLSDYFVFER